MLLDLAIVGVLWLASVVADGGAGRWIRAAPANMGSKLSRAAVARALRVLRHSGARVRDLVVRTTGDGRDAVARVARRRNAARVDATAGRAGVVAGGKRSSRHAALALSRRRAARDERSALQRPRADRTISRRRTSSSTLAVRAEETTSRSSSRSTDALALFGYRSFTAWRIAVDRDRARRRGPTSSRSAAGDATSACSCCSRPRSARSPRCG